MNTKRLLLSIITLLVILNVVLLSYAFFKNNNRRPMSQVELKSENSLKRRLGLSVQQAEIFDSLRVQHFRETSGLARAIRTKRKALLRMMGSEADSILINNKLEEINAKNNQLERINFSHWMKLRKLCTSKQAKKFDTLVVRMLDRSPGPGRTKRNAAANNK